MVKCCDYEEVPYDPTLVWLELPQFMEILVRCSD